MGAVATKSSPCSASIVDVERPEQILDLGRPRSSVPRIAFTRRGAHRDARALDRIRVAVDDAVDDLGSRDLREQLHRARGAGRGAVGIDAALEARARLRTQAEPLRRRGDARRLEVGRFEQDLAWCSASTSESRPPMIPAIACGARSASQMSRSSGCERALDAVEGRHLLARLREPHDEARDRPGGRDRTRAADGTVRASRSW